MLHVVPDLTPALPEMVLAAGALILLMYGVFAGAAGQRIVTSASVVLIAVVAFLVVTADEARVVTFDGAFIVDAFARFTKILTLIGSAAAVLMSSRYLQDKGIERFEYPVLILLATTGMMMMLSANDLIALYLGLELQSLAAYVVASIHRDDLRSTEAGLKYFVLGALSSGMLLYGCSLIYGFSGSISFATIATAIQGEPSIGLVFGLVFLMAGLAFKISAVPFHMWTPDVYEGAPTPVTAFFASAPKVAAVLLATRVCLGALEPAMDAWRQIVIFAALASILLGAVAAYGQTNFKRLLAYSSINNVGFVLIGIAGAGVAG